MKVKFNVKCNIRGTTYNVGDVGEVTDADVQAFQGTKNGKPLIEVQLDARRRIKKSDHDRD